MSPSSARHPAGLPAGLAALDRCLVMGVLNTTPDSFSDGGRWLDQDAAVAHGLAMAADGADLVDVGGESTRPGAERVDEQEELRRVLPVVRRLVAEGVVVSVDTMRATVAAAAVEAGAALVNDVSGGLADPGVPRVAAQAGVPYVAMHWRGHSTEMESRAEYGDVVVEVRAELAARLDALHETGLPRSAVVLDPGLGFAKRAPHDWALLAHLHALATLGCPLLVGASRKRFVGRALLDDPASDPPPPHERDAASAAVSALAAAAGAWAVRVHDVRSSRDAVRVARAWTRGPAGGPGGGAR